MLHAKKEKEIESDYSFIHTRFYRFRFQDFSRWRRRSLMDDVDRLFQCFKCGVSPPQSAVRPKKRTKSRTKRLSSETKVSEQSHVSSPGSVQLSADKSGINALSVAEKAPGTKKRISPLVFYGSPHGVPPKRPIRLWRLLHEIRVDLSEQHKENLRREVWATFPRQEEAIKFTKGHKHVRLFSYQDHFNGQRRFLVSTYQEFWKRYKIMDPNHRHHYEVIQEGLPCHLYFDLEFNKKANIGRNGDEMIDILVSVIYEALNEKYSIHGCQEWIVELDSSTKEKFSRHLIIRIPKTAFKDNSHAGAFVSDVCSRIQNTREKDKLFEKLFVIKDLDSNESSRQLFVDTAVYSRNRCFRLALSSKAGKNSVLQSTGRFKCKGMVEEDVFMASLICNMDTDCEKLLVCKTDLDCAKILHFDTEINNNFSNNWHNPPTIRSDACSSNFSTTCLMGKSPFPTVDRFIESIATIGNVSGKIRSWYWFSEYGLMVYSMSRNRYCERIGRQHKSNHVIYVVDLRRAVYYQKCHDPDCQGYRSPVRPLPVGIIPDSSVILSMVHYGLPEDDELRFQIVNNEMAHNFPHTDDTIDNWTNDSWWIEAIRIADDVENNQMKTEPTCTEIVDGDEEWWSAVERTAYMAELNYSSH